jgi:hypothetical protein
MPPSVAHGDRNERERREESETPGSEGNFEQ